MSRLTALLSAGLLLGSWGCDSSTRSNVVDAQWYHAHLATEAGDKFPFFLQVPADCEGTTATIVNGEERLRADCRRSPVGFVVDFPVYGTQIEAWFKPEGTLIGHWCRERQNGRDPILSFKARPISKPDPRDRFPAEWSRAKASPTRADVAGTWRMEFDDSGVARGVLVQNGSGVVTGTVEVPQQYGDLRFLAGNMRGARLQLSTFDGQHVGLLQGEVKPDGTLSGEWVGEESRDPFVAKRAEDFHIPDPLARVRPQSETSRLDLEALRDPKYTGKAVIVELFGTWCPNCNDHAPLLVDLYREYGPQGLEILGLAFEYTESREQAERRVREFKKKHGVEWDVVIADSTLEELANEGLAGLSPIEGVPVTIFVNPDGTVHAVYTGFSGPATGAAHREARAQFEKLAEEILDGV